MKTGCSGCFFWWQDLKKAARNSGGGFTGCTLPIRASSITGILWTRSAPNIVGAYLFDRSRAPLRRLARSGLLWERRIAIVATFYFIRRNQFDDTLEIAGMLLDDKHDLMHKAAGWMLREVGKRDREAEEVFLREHCSRMPRTMLRYAIERFPREERLLYLGGLSAARQRKALLD